jgi:hypothetical protein
VWRARITLALLDPVRVTFTCFDGTSFAGTAIRIYAPARFRIERAKLKFTLTDRQIDAQLSRARRISNPFFTP